MSKQAIHTIKLYDASIAEEKFLQKESRYDVHKNLLEETEWDEDGGLVKKTENRYNDKNQLEESVHTDAEAFAQVSRFFYNDKGKLSKDQHFFEGDDEPYQEVVYDYSDESTLQTIYSPPGEPVSKTETVFNAAGKEEQVSFTDLMDSDLDYERVLFYDEQGRLVQEDRYNSRHEIQYIEKTTYEPLEDGTTLETLKRLGMNAKVMEMRETIRKDKKEISEKIYLDIEKDTYFSRSWEYDAEGKLAKLEFISQDEVVFFSETYQRNENGDIIRREISRTPRWLDILKFHAEAYECYEYEITYF